MSGTRAQDSVFPPLAIIGLGRMGRAVDALATGRGWSVRARIGRGEAVTRERLNGAAVAVEFTTGTAAADNVRACLGAGCAVVVGTTGWYDALPSLRADVERGAGAMLWAPNFSVGAAAMTAAAVAVAHALRAVGHFDAHLVETHHAAKVDAPSGTARAVAAAVGEAMGRVVPVTSVRVGQVPGEHEMIFDGPFEQLRVQHIVRDRRVFADGALVAAKWLVGRRGVFTMHDVLREAGDAPAPPSGRRA
jgi:4-hydroxy-tetrahydrodipicolinate reductase